MPDLLLLGLPAVRHIDPVATVDLVPLDDPLVKQNECCIPDPVGVDGGTARKRRHGSVDSGFEVY
jgi:hypothetical protein